MLVYTFSWVTLLLAGDTGRTKHNVGLPEALGGTPVPLPEPDVLAIGQGDSGFLLYRFCFDGRFAGDTWHPTLEEAQGQANWEYPGRVAGWTEVLNLDRAGVISWGRRSRDIRER